MSGVNSVYPVKYFVYFYSELFHCAGASEVKTLVQAIICQSAPNLHTLYPPLLFYCSPLPCSAPLQSRFIWGGVNTGDKQGRPLDGC